MVHCKHKDSLEPESPNSFAIVSSISVTVDASLHYASTSSRTIADLSELLSTGLSSFHVVSYIPHYYQVQFIFSLWKLKFYEAVNDERASASI